MNYRTGSSGFETQSFRVWSENANHAECKSSGTCGRWSVVALGLLAAFSAPSSAQGGPTVTIGYSQLNGVADDWTQHHVVFSNPGTEEQAIKAGRYDEWLKIVNDPRYVMHQMKRGLPAQGPASGDVAAFEAFRAANRNIEPVGGGVLPIGGIRSNPKVFIQNRPSTLTGTSPWGQQRRPLQSHPPQSGVLPPARRVAPAIL